jgi:mannosylglycoprotein endo-beta-mannosidase
MEMATTFLNCRIGSLPFKYLGLPIGANPSCATTWEPLVDHIKKRLLSWRNKYVSLGGRIVLINSVLNSMPIFHLSFLKLPCKVRKKIVSIQREFLWGGARGGKKVSWVRWGVVCKAKKNGGLGVRDIDLVNVSLLAKWRWRLLQPGLPLWKEVLVARYGAHILVEADWSRCRVPTSASKWWKNIVAIDDVVPDKKWFSEALVRKIGNGLATPFWNSKWIGDSPLAITFPRLFSLSIQKENNVRDLCNDDGTWVFSWRRNLFRWEEELFSNLLLILESVNFSLDDDAWCWLVDEDGEFSVKSSYNYLVEELASEDNEEEVVVNVLAQIWESPAPSKVIAFSWQLLLDRIPTRRNLEVRNMLPMDVPWECLGCVGNFENSTHLFLHCPCAMWVCGEIFKWIGVSIVIPPSLPLLFELVKGAARNAKIRRGFLLIWHASLWTMWKARNSSIFSTGCFSPRVIVEEIKVVSWKWCLARLKVTPCMYYEWIWDPGDCLLR